MSSEEGSEGDSSDVPESNLPPSKSNDDLSAGFTSPFLLTRDDITSRGVLDHEVGVYQAKFYQDSFAISTWLDHFEGMLTSVPQRFLSDETELQIPPRPPRAVTFDTFMVDVSFEEAKELIKLYRIERLNVEEEENIQVDVEIVEGLKQRLDEAILEHSSSSDESLCDEGFFMKLDTRSPKDAPASMSNDPQVRSLVRAVFDEWVEEMYQKIEKDDDRHFLTLMQSYPEQVHLRFKKAMANCMRITSGEWALKLLSNSHRVYEDLAKGTRFGRDHFQFRIILREWVQHVVDNPQYEFRTFVCKRSMHAISQYFCDNFFPELVARKEEILEEILAFYEKIGDSIPHESFVLDVFIGSKEMGPLVIELNPFHVGAGGCLFSWSSDRDCFLNGPLEFRIRQHSAIPPPEEEKDGWRILVNRALSRSWEEFLLETYGSPSRKRCLVQ